MQWAFWKCWLANDLVCFWGQVWKGVLLRGICNLKIIADITKNSRKLSHFRTSCEIVGGEMLSFRKSIDELILNRC